MHFCLFPSEYDREQSDLIQPGQIDQTQQHDITNSQVERVTQVGVSDPVPQVIQGNGSQRDVIDTTHQHMEQSNSNGMPDIPNTAATEKLFLCFILSRFF